MRIVKLTALSIQTWCAKRYVMQDTRLSRSRLVETRKVSNLVFYVLTSIIGFIHRYALSLAPKHHFQNSYIAKPFGISLQSGSCANINNALPYVLGIIFQYQVECSLLRELNIFQGFYWLMVLIHLHTFDFIRRQILTGLCVFSAKQIHTLDIELIDGLTLILYCSVRLYLKSRHLGYHIGYRAVLPLAEG